LYTTPPRSTISQLVMLNPGESGYTSTILGMGDYDTVLVGIPNTITTGRPFTTVILGPPFINYRSITTYLPATASGFTSFISESDYYLVGVPSSVGSLTATATATSGAPSTSGTPGSMTTALTTPPRSTISQVVILNPGASGYTSTILGMGDYDTVLVGIPNTITTGLPFTTVILGPPPDLLYPPVTTYLPATASGFTSFIAESSYYLIGVPSSVGSLTTRTTTLPSGVSGFTSTVLPSGTSVGEVVVGLPIDAFYVTITTALPAGATGFTSTLPTSGTFPGQVVVGLPSPGSSAASKTTTPTGAQGVSTNVSPSSASQSRVVVSLPTPGSSAASMTMIPSSALGVSTQVGLSSTSLGGIVASLPSSEVLTIPTTFPLESGIGFTSITRPSGTSPSAIVVPSEVPTGVVCSFPFLAIAVLDQKHGNSTKPWRFWGPYSR